MTVLYPTSEQEFDEAAQRIYNQRWRAQLEAAHWGEVMALEPESGDYVLGPTLNAVTDASEQRFGDSPVYIFRIGGGGVARIGGARRDRNA